jgi:hypothetical protein
LQEIQSNPGLKLGVELKTTPLIIPVNDPDEKLGPYIWMLKGQRYWLSWGRRMESVRDTLN